MKLINLTPHTISIRTGDCITHDFPPSGDVARVETTPGELVAEPALHEMGVHTARVPIYSAPSRDSVIGLPQPAEGVVYIVSTMVAAAVPDRPDVVSPGTGPNDEAIRVGGRIAAVTRLISAQAARRDICYLCGEDNGPVSPLTGRGLSRIGYDCFRCGGN